ncbi:DUF2892 domain-containing protein [Bradyrhizobium sp. 190]|uniref:YgaP family membrane protein n=1 Tax=Bradyrhizobium sp. 190 TaxID=2782658 RepID=UPI001FF7E404|nr:DUF2892 domain-containing protein [Bradyrhizobium sp. 190]MCK1513900.1 DUF2892 domain-containing protein [Bradyrhizobium sp. 190]
MALVSTKNRVPTHTVERVNERIKRETELRVQKLASDPASIATRLKGLDAEWDIERAIEANASVLVFAGVALGYFAHPYWLALPALVTAFLFQHAIQGWCPPVPILRRMRFRTVYEIEQERHALKALRGDYESVARATDKASAAIRAAEA